MKDKINNTKSISKDKIKNTKSILNIALASGLLFGMILSIIYLFKKLRIVMQIVKMLKI